MNRDFSHYAKRDRVLRSLGFVSYEEYLGSELWKKIRLEVFQVKGSQCFLCIWSKATQVHHCRYARIDMLGKRLIGMFPLCGDCHREVEFEETGAKLTVPEMRRAFNKARKGRSKRLEEFNMQSKPA